MWCNILLVIIYEWILFFFYLYWCWNYIVIWINVIFLKIDFIVICKGDFIRLVLTPTTIMCRSCLIYIDLNCVALNINNINTFTLQITSVYPSWVPGFKFLVFQVGCDRVSSTTFLIFISSKFSLSSTTLKCLLHFVNTLYLYLSYSIPKKAW